MNVQSIGSVVRTIGDMVFVKLPRARVGEGVVIHSSSGERIAGSVTAVERKRVAVAAFGSLSGIAVGDRVETSGDAQTALLGIGALGRALDAAGVPMDTRGPLIAERVPVTGVAIAPVRRRPIEVPLWTGIRAIDGLLTVGRGARIGIFGAPGAGKTTLLESIARGVRGDAVVLALIGERGREAAAWLRRVDARTTIVCATSDRNAAERSRAAEVAMAQAVTLRERGLHVVVIVDSLARYCAALREQRSALGEPVGRGGYPPSVFADLARLLERAGNGTRGSITLLASVLSDGGDEREPLSDAARSLLDGHIVLSAELARGGHYPAIDVLSSASRTMDAVIDARHAGDARVVRAALALLERTKEARALGLTGDGDPRLLQAVAGAESIERFLVQNEACMPSDTLMLLHELGEFLR
jgi:ATP synthase in type III secretion protein N